MFPKSDKSENRASASTKISLASVALRDAYTDFILSRQAMLCSERTVKWYAWQLGKFLEWLEGQGVTNPDEVTPRIVRAYLAELAGRSLKDTTLHGHARAIRTLLLFFHGEGYIPQVVKFEMPKLADKELPVLNADELRRVIGACQTARDKALVMFLADTGIRRNELLALTWNDLDMATGAVKVLRGKGGKYRLVFCGAKTRRALLKFRRELSTLDGPIFPLTGAGLRSALLRIGRRAGVHVTAHALRRTFATLAVKAGMNVIMLQALMGHSTAEMTAHYVRWVESDLQAAHRQASPIDTL